MSYSRSSQGEMSKLDKLTVNMNGISASLNRRPRGRTELEGVIPVKLHAGAHQLVHVRRSCHFVVATSGLGVPARVVPPEILPSQRRASLESVVCTCSLADFVQGAKMLDQ